MDGDSVGDDEVLYRRVGREWASFRDGAWRLTSEAFNDRQQKPSVDRAILRAGPQETQRLVSDGICTLVGGEVRGISGVIPVNANVGPDQAIQFHNVDVIHRPVTVPNSDGTPENQAHAQVETSPTFANKSRWNKLKDALCRLAQGHGWLIEPDSIG